MREIKFRGLTLNGQWVYGLLAHIEKDGAITKAGWYISNSFGVPYAYAVRPETVGQYIDIKDKNGKEVYEGDIVKFRQHPHKSQTGEVKYSIKGARFFISYFDNDLERKRNYPRSEYFGTLNSIEVIGNIYENPELLK